MVPIPRPVSNRMGKIVRHRESKSSHPPQFQACTYFMSSVSITFYTTLHSIMMFMSSASYINRGMGDGGLTLVIPRCYTISPLWCILNDHFQFNS